jgi:glutathione synthase/RimK-type ligase-like ATP-grasp enzyme
MKKYDVVLLTESRYDTPKQVDWYIQNILTEDDLVRDALENKGLEVTRKDWSDPYFDWSSTRMALFRTTWDYFHKFQHFYNWLDRISKKTFLCNPESLVRWNLDKHYLKDLENKGINVTPTVYINKGSKISLREIYKETNWKETVLKPTVSGAARHTYKMNTNNIADHEAIFKDLIRQEDMMLQEFQKSVLEKGEIAFMVIGGKFTHAILKKAKEGDFRVQDDFGGTVHNYDANDEEIKFAEKVVSVCEPQPVYARVDIIDDNDGNPAVTELELIEPEMWFRHNPEAAETLAESIIEYINLLK